MEWVKQQKPPEIYPNFWKSASSKRLDDFKKKRTQA